MSESDVSLREYFEALLREKDARDSQRYDDQVKAVGAALLAQQSAVAAALAAAEKAVAKAETATEKRFEATNEFRAQLTDQAGTFMPRVEAEQRLSTLSDKIDELKTAVSEGTGRSSGFSAGWVYLVQLGGLVTGLVVLYAALRH